MITYGTDKLIVINQLDFVDLERNETPRLNIKRLNQISDNYGANYLCATQCGGKLVIACQDRQIRTFSATNGELLKAINGATCNDGALTKVYSLQNLIKNLTNRLFF